MLSVNFMQCFFILCQRKICRTSKTFAGPVDPRCYWSYGATSILSLQALRPDYSRKQRVNGAERKNQSKCGKTKLLQSDKLKAIK